MAGPKDVTIRAQALNGTWQTMGGETARGLYPENVSLEADSWGSSAASFNLRRDPRAFFPDIGAYTPIEIDVGSTLVWSGRVRETPSQVAERVINVQCEGWQFHLDDDIYQRTYVHSDLTAWRDARSLPTANLSRLRTNGAVGTGEGQLTLGWGQGATLNGVATNDLVAVTVDLGPSSTALRVSLDWRVVNGNGVIGLICRGHDSPDFTAIGDDAITIGHSAVSGSGQTNSGSFASAHRYVTVFMYRNDGASSVLANDILTVITGARIYANAAYESGGASVLVASTVVGDALDRATSLLSTDRSAIDATSFSIPSYTPGWQTARQAWISVDAFHGWMKQIDVSKRPVYTALPSRPKFEVGAHSAINDDDASANSGQDIYNKTVVAAQAPSGESVEIVRRQGDRDPATFNRPSSTQLSNPSFDVDVAGWAATGASGATVVRNTTVPKSGAGCLEVRSGTGGGTIYGYCSAFNGALRPGRPYALSGWLRRDTAATVSVYVASSSGVAYYISSLLTLDTTTTAGVWTQFTLPFVCPDDGFAQVVFFAGSTHPTNSAMGQLDSLTLMESTATLVDRRNFTRTMQLPVGATLPSDGVAAGQIGDVWLADHVKTPFRGSVTVTGDESVREITTGRDVGLEQLLLNTGQLIRFSDRTDPDTGGHGRDGRIAAVSYQPATNTAQATIDSSRTNFDALLARLAVIQGG